MSLDIYYIEHKKKPLKAAQPFGAASFHAYLSLVDELAPIKHRLEDIHFTNNGNIKANLIRYPEKRRLKQRPQRLISGPRDALIPVWDRAKDTAKWFESISIPFDANQKPSSDNCRALTMGVVYALGLQDQVRNLIETTSGTHHQHFPILEH